MQQQSAHAAAPPPRPPWLPLSCWKHARPAPPGPSQQPARALFRYQSCQPQKPQHMRAARMLSMATRVLMASAGRARTAGWRGRGRRVGTPPRGQGWPRLAGALASSPPSRLHPHLPAPPAAAPRNRLQARGGARPPQRPPLTSRIFSSLRRMFCSSRWIVCTTCSSRRISVCGGRAGGCVRGGLLMPAQRLRWRRERRQRRRAPAVQQGPEAATGKRQQGAPPSHLDDVQAVALGHRLPAYLFSKTSTIKRGYLEG